MSKRSFVLPIFLLLGGLLVTSAEAFDPPVDSFGARLATYDKATGESYFALSVTPKVRPDAAKVQDVVILVDTSASQKGLFRDDSLAAVSELVKRLDRHDRVRLFAVDLEAIPMHETFVPASSPEVKAAIAKLKLRVPLGATDMVAALTAAADSFGEGSTNPRVVIYMGDGISNANLLERSEIKAAVDQLITCQAAVSSYAIGPNRNIPLWAVLANQTGGMVFVDTDKAGASQMAGASLAKVAQQTVFWPRDVKLSSGLVESYPSTVPPLRTDRDTVVIGKLERGGAQRLTMTAEANGQLVELAWDLVAERSSEDFAFLPVLVDMARDDGGLTLPTVGSAGLREVARVLFSGSSDLSLMGKMPEPVEDVQESVVHFVSYQEEAEPPAETGPPAEEDLLMELEPATDLVEKLEGERGVITGKIRAEVEVGLSDARKQMGANSDAAVQALKAILDNVRRVPDLEPAARTNLEDRIITAIREASRRKAEHDETRRITQENQAIADEAGRLAAEMADRRAHAAQLMEKFDALVDEGLEFAFAGRTEEAKDNFDAGVLQVANPIEGLLPFDPIGLSARYNAGFLRQLTGLRKFRLERHRNFVNTLYEVERAAVPFPDEPPVVYPAPDFWERISEDRQKYKSMDLLGSGTKEKKIYDALLEETILEFDEAPLSEVVDYLKTARSIPIVIDRRALDDIGLGSDTPVTISLAGITLRSALKIMLKELDLTYVIRDEVLKITTPEEAELELITKVYPVGDLVIPIINMGGNGMMMGGGMGGGGMGGMGGMGGGGMGGMGGMGGGGFGGGFGGMMAVDDDLTLGVKKPSFQEPVQQRPVNNVVKNSLPAGPAEPIVLDVVEGQSVDDAWEAFFVENKHAIGDETLLLDRRIRATARRLSRGGEHYAQIVTMLQAAIRNSQSQPWMYEALGLAMLAAEAPKAEIERTLMSAVDMSGDPTDMMDVAIYMSQVGLDECALQLFRDVAFSNPFRPEPYALGLASAKRLENVDGIKWASLGILSQAWPEEQSGVEDRALRLAKAMVNQLREEGKEAEAAEFEKALEKARDRDVVCKVTWTGDADVDLIIEEPGGTICSLQNARTTAGGVMVGDAYSSGTQSSGYVETYVCPKGFSGKYRMLVHRVWGDVTAGKVTVDILTRNPDRPHIHEQITLGDKDAVVLFDVTNGRRSEHLAQRQLANLESKQVAADRAMLSRQLNRYEDSLAKRDFVRSRARQRGWSGGRPMGFRPVITTLPQGTQLMPGTYAVVSADRRYVRVTPQPMFSFIGEVNTFDFGGGPSGGLPDDDDDNTGN